MIMAYLLVALLGAAIALFAIQNNSAVVIRFLGWHFEGPQSLVVLLSILAGVILTSLLGIVGHWKMRSRIRQLESRLARSETSSSPEVSKGPP
jgi:uncharacterized integral membrane protein